MKKIFLLLGAAILAVVACNKSEVVNTLETNRGEMAFRAISAPVTKGAELTGVTLPNTWGIYAAATQYSPGNVIENSSFFVAPYEQTFGTDGEDPENTNRMNASADTRLWKASGATDSFTHSPMYWPIGGAILDFLAYSMPFAKHADTGLSTGVWSATWDNPKSDVASSVTFNKVDTYVNQVDLLYASANNQNVANNAGKDDANKDQSVAMKFQHAQALLLFNVRVNSVANNLININEIEFFTDKHVQDLRDYQAALDYYAEQHPRWTAWKAAYDAIDPSEQAAWAAIHQEPDNPAEPVDPGRIDDDVTLLTFGTFNVNNKRNNLIYTWSGLETRAANYRMLFGAHGDWVAVKAVHDAWAAKKTADGYDAMDAGEKAAWDATNPEPAAPGSEPDPDAVSWSNKIVLDQTSKTVQAYNAPIAYVTGDEYAQLGETLLIPEQKKVNFTIKYQMDMDGDGSFAGENVMYYTFNDIRGQWQAGKKYFYNLDITLNEIVITESVSDFVGVNGSYPIN